MGTNHYNRDQLAEIMGANLRAIRTARNLTQAEVAEAISVSDEFYARLERGKSLPSMDTLLALVSALDVDADDIFGVAIAPRPLADPLANLPPRVAQLVRRISAHTLAAQRVINLLLAYCERHIDGTAKPPDDDSS